MTIATLVSVGDRFITKSGKPTTAVPQFNVRQPKAAIKIVNGWLKQNALQEVENRFDMSHMPTMIKGLDVNNWSQADGEMVLGYLFGRCDGDIADLRITE